MSTAANTAGQQSAAAGGCCGSAMMRAAPDKAEIKALATPGLIERFRIGVENFDPRVFQLSAEQLDMAFLPDAGVGRWPVRVLVGHLADAELVFVHRMRRAVGESNPVLALWDEDSFVDSGMYGVGGVGGVGGGGGGGGGASSERFPVGGFIATVHTLRRWTAEWLLTLTDEQWARKAMHPERGPLSVRDLVASDTWHLEHHAWYLNAKVERLVGPITAAVANGGEGCGPSCGCKGKK